MGISDGLLAELNHETIATRKELERVPEGKFDWKPHPKSMTLGRLASHLAELPMWAEKTVSETELDMAPPGQPAPKASNFSTRAEVLATYDQMLAQARAALGRTPDAAWMVPWTLKAGGKAIFSLPRIVVIRNFVFNHIVHHRAQLGVYLRLLDLPVPSIYGPSADEPGM